MAGLLANRRAETVLVVDDDMVCREVLATVLTLKGYTVQTAASGEEAVAALTTGAFVPQVVLMDVRMDGLSGAELVAELRARARAVIIAISAGEPRAETIAGADEFLRKPFSPEELARMLARRAAAAQAETPDAADPEAMAQEADGANTVVLDRTILAQLRAAMPENSVRELYEAVLADLREKLDALQAAMARGDGAAVRRIGHAVKGGCGLAGAAEAAHLGARLEAESDKLDNSRAIVLELRTAVEHWKAMLDAEFKTARGGLVP